MTILILGLYSLAGALELGGVAGAAIDLKRKAPKAREWREMAHRDEQGEFTGKGTYEQMEHLNEFIDVLLDSQWLRYSAALLAAGIVVGTVANALNT